MTKRTKRGKIMNIPTGQTGFGQLDKQGRIYKNDLLNTDYTRQDMGTVRKLRGN